MTTDFIMPKALNTELNGMEISLINVGFSLRASYDILNAIRGSIRRFAERLDTEMDRDAKTVLLVNHGRVAMLAVLGALSASPLAASVIIKKLETDDPLPDFDTFDTSNPPPVPVVNKERQLASPADLEAIRKAQEKRERKAERFLRLARAL